MKNYVKTIVCLLTVALFAGCGKLEKENKKPYMPLEPELQEDFTETAFGINLEMVYVKGGEFLMGATVEQGDDANDNENPVRTIKLDSYHIGRYEVTQAQWKAVVGREPSLSEGDNYPIDRNISWNDAQEFCKKLSAKTGKRYVLPTEAQWEYAARGGCKSKRFKYAGGNDMEEVGWYSGNSGTERDTVLYPEAGIHSVGMRKANELGIYDMSGNAVEWCSDWYSDTYDLGDDYNPQGPVAGGERVIRGGGIFSPEEICRVSWRIGYSPERNGFPLGFRVAVLLYPGGYPD